MDKIVYVYGSARDASTRQLRRSALPREMVVRIGLWTIRPSRTTAIEFARLAPHETEILHKMSTGLIKLQNGDGADYSIEEVRAAFAALKGTPEAPNYMTMPYAKLMELMRSERPTQAVWDAFVERSLTSDDPELPSLDQRIRALSGYSEIVRQMGVSTERSDELLRAASEPSTPPAPPSDKVDQNKVETQPPPDEGSDEETESSKEPETQSEPDDEQMDFTEPKATESTPEAEPKTETAETEVKAEGDVQLSSDDGAEHPADGDAVKEQLSEVAAAMEQTAPAAETTETAQATAPTARAAQLPDGWRGLSNGKLKDLITSLSITMPAKTAKADLIGAIEAWAAEVV